MSGICSRVWKGGELTVIASLFVVEDFAGKCAMPVVLYTRVHVCHQRVGLSVSVAPARK